MKRIIVIFALFTACSPASAQWDTHGERIRSYGDSLWGWASETWTNVRDRTATGTCRHCGRETMFRGEGCFDCSRIQTRKQLEDWVGQALDSSRRTWEDLQDPARRRELANRLLSVKQQLQDRNQNDSEHERNRRRQAIDDLGNVPVGRDRTPLREVAREVVRKWVPGLEGTDFAQDPVRVMSYYLVLDGKGFVRDVKFLRGPMGQPMTLLEAYEFYSRTDPERARDLLEIMDDLRKLGSPDAGDEQLPALFDALGRAIRLLSPPDR